MYNSYKDSMRKQACPYELNMKGDCPYRASEHGTYLHHYARRHQGFVVRDIQGKPLCRWSMEDCWEAHDPNHRFVFSHI